LTSRSRCKISADSRHALHADSAALNPFSRRVHQQRLHKIRRITHLADLTAASPSLPSSHPVRRGCFARHRKSRTGAASRALPCKQVPGGSGTPSSATRSGREKLAGCFDVARRQTFARDRVPQIPRWSAERRASPMCGQRERPAWDARRFAKRLRAGVIGPRRVLRRHPSACRRSAPSLGEGPTTRGDFGGDRANLGGGNASREG
jgi:hypothetical protein